MSHHWWHLLVMETVFAQSYLNTVGVWYLELNLPVLVTYRLSTYDIRARTWTFVMNMIKCRIHTFESNVSMDNNAEFSNTFIVIKWCTNDSSCIKHTVNAIQIQYNGEYCRTINEICLQVWWRSQKHYHSLFHSSVRYRLFLYFT